MALLAKPESGAASQQLCAVPPPGPAPRWRKPGRSLFGLGEGGKARTASAAPAGRVGAGAGAEKGPGQAQAAAGGLQEQSGCGRAGLLSLRRSRGSSEEGAAVAPPTPAPTSPSSWGASGWCDFSSDGGCTDGRGSGRRGSRRQEPGAEALAPMSVLPSVATTQPAGLESPALGHKSPAQPTPLATRLARLSGRHCSLSPAGLLGLGSWRAAATSEACRARSGWQSEVQELLELAPGRRWHVVCAAEGGPWAPGEAPPETEVVLVLADLRCPAPAAVREAVQAFAAAGAAPAPPVVVLLLGEAPGPGDVTAFSAVQELLASCGADDVVHKPGGQPDLELAVAISLARAARQRRCAEALAELRAECEGLRGHAEALEQQLREAEEELGQCEPPEGLFWQLAHQSLEGLPHLRPELPAAPLPGQELGHLRLGARLGGGACSTVFAAAEAGGPRQSAVRAVRKSALRGAAATRLWQEVWALRCLEHPGVVRLHGLLHGPCHVFLHMEFAGPHNLFQSLRSAGKHFPLERTRRLLAQLLGALAYCHASDVAHRDVRPENIAVSDCGWKAKLLDFGSAVPASQRCSDRAGTVPFMAPEVLAADECSSYAPASADVWSSGAVLLEMLCGVDSLGRMLAWGRTERPCRARGEEVLGLLRRPAALLEAVQEEAPGPLCPGAAALLGGLLAARAQERPSAAAAAESPWLQA